MQELLARSKPGVVLIELHPHAVEATGYEGGALRLLEQVYEWGYTHVSHSGCASAAENPLHICFTQSLEHGKGAKH